jgi:hypothetical protein
MVLAERFSGRATATIPRVLRPNISKAIIPACVPRSEQTLHDFRDGGSRMSVQPMVRELVADSSDASIWIYSVSSGVLTLGAAILIQWLVYDDWLHEAGLRVTGSVLAGLFLGSLVFRSLWHAREKRRRMLELLQSIRWTNDRIRNSLQAIECVTYAASPEITEDVRSAVDNIETILNDLLASPDSQAARRAKPRAVHVRSG